MPRKTRDNAFELREARAAMDAAAADIANGGEGVRVTCPTYAAALNFRKKLYRVRNIESDVAEKNFLPVGSFDHLVPNIETPEGTIIYKKPREYTANPELMKRPHVVVIALHKQQVMKIETSDGKPLDIDLGIPVPEPSSNTSIALDEALKLDFDDGIFGDD